ncbi:uncharacterized protein LOC129760880 [Uranotaenia lowii]|uniref:uncharacterized protein LOC129760880 n=1 Tax=Uranotaenia lowii TaxID=190385 RepID=UPI00247A868F|nr:uncharacterized protein LOC129760880 [Uranotaenia lowii]
MFSLDVTSLFTNVPTSSTFEYIYEKWHKLRKYTDIPLGSLEQALRIVLGASFFQYSSKFYEQIHGVPMGSPISCVAANIAMERLEQECIEKLKKKNVHISIYRRYVDDCFIVAREEDVNTIFDTFNSAHTSLKFTIERENDAKIRFLDMTLHRTGEMIEKSWFPKQPDGRYLDFFSESPYTHKSNTAFALIDRALKLSDAKNRKNSIVTVKSILKKNNYPQNMVDNIIQKRVHLMFNTLENKEHKPDGSRFVSLPYIPRLTEKVAKILRRYNLVAAPKPCDKIKSNIFTKLKDPIPLMQQTNVVYAISCSCGNEYIGQTSQTLFKRIKQHENNVRLKQKSTGLAQHALDNGPGHVFGFSKTRILERITNTTHRRIAEKLHIKMRENRAVNIQQDTKGISSVYNGLWKKLREKDDAEVRRKTVVASTVSGSSSNNNSDHTSGTAYHRLVTKHASRSSTPTTTVVRSGGIATVTPERHTQDGFSFRLDDYDFHRDADGINQTSTTTSTSGEARW